MLKVKKGHFLSFKMMGLALSNTTTFYRNCFDVSHLLIGDLVMQHSNRVAKKPFSCRALLTSPKLDLRCLDWLGAKNVQLRYELPVREKHIYEEVSKKDQELVVLEVICSQSLEFALFLDVCRHFENSQVKGRFLFETTSNTCFKAFLFCPGGYRHLSLYPTS